MQINKNIKGKKVDISISINNINTPNIKDIETAKAVLDMAKQMYQNEDARVKAIDAKIYYIFTISGVLLASASFILGQPVVSKIKWFIKLMMITKFAIILLATLAIVFSIIGLISRSFKCIEISEFSSTKFMGLSGFDAIYEIIVTLEDAIKKNKKIIKRKTMKLIFQWKILSQALIC